MSQQARFAVVALFAEVKFIPVLHYLDTWIPAN